LRYPKLTRLVAEIRWKARVRSLSAPLLRQHHAALARRLRWRLGARVIEMASRVRLAFAAACPDASLIRHIATALMPAGP
jgi:hypothetical protein